MKRYCLALAAALTLSAGSGCCLMDHLLGHHCGCGGGCQDCAGEACSYCGPHCGACGCCGGDCSCPPGGCGPGGCANCNGATSGMDSNIEEGFVDDTPAAQAPTNRAPARMRPASHVRPGVRQTSYNGPSGYEAAAQGPVQFAGHQEFQPNCPSCLQCRAPCGRAGNCSPCPNCCDGHRAVADQLGGPAGPPCGQVTYPYYTTRGPRDFLLNNPPRIGP